MLGNKVSALSRIKWRSNGSRSNEVTYTRLFRRWTRKLNLLRQKKNKLPFLKTQSLFTKQKSKICLISTWLTNRILNDNQRRKSKKFLIQKSYFISIVRFNHHWTHVCELFWVKLLKLQNSVLKEIQSNIFIWDSIG